MSSLTGTTGGGGGFKLKIKLGGAAQQQQQQQQGTAPGGSGQPPLPRPAAPSASEAALPAASNATTGTLGTGSGGGFKLRLKRGGGAGSTAGTGAVAVAAAGSAGSSGATAAGNAAAAVAAGGGDYYGSQGDYYGSQSQQMQPPGAGQYPDAGDYSGYDSSAFAAQQYLEQQQLLYEQHQQQQQQQKLKLGVKVRQQQQQQQQQTNELRYTASGRVQRAASRGLARLIAEEGGVPQDHSLAAPPPGADTRYYALQDDPDSPLTERRSTRFAQRKTIDASQYIDPDEVDFDAEDYVLPEGPKEPKEPKPKREPKPKKEKKEKKADDGSALLDDDDEEFDEMDLAMEDNLADEDYDAAMEEEDEAMEVRTRRGGGSRSSRAAFSERPPRSSSRRAAAAGVAAAVAAAAAGDYYDSGAGGLGTPPLGFTPGGSPGPSSFLTGTQHTMSGGGGAAASGGGTAAGGSRGTRGGSRRGASRGRGGGGDSDDEFDDYVEDEEESDEFGGGIGGAWGDDEDACLGTVIGGGYRHNDYSSLSLKGDHYNRPLWVCSDGRIFLETYSPIYKQAYDFLIAIAEPVCRPESIHEYVLTPQSLYAAVSVGLDKETIIGVLDKLSKVRLTSKLKKFIGSSTKSYGKVKLVLKHNRFWVETSDMEVLELLLANPTIHAARAFDTPGADDRGLVRRRAVKEHAAAHLFKATMAAAQEGAAAGAAAAAADGRGGLAAEAAAAVANAAAPTAVTTAPPKPAPAAPPAAAAAALTMPAAAAAAPAGRFFDPFGDSESESDPEDFTGVQRARPRPAAAEPAAAVPAAAGSAAASGAAAAAADGLEDDNFDDDVIGVPRARRAAAAAARAVDAAAGGEAAAAVAAAAAGVGDDAAAAAAGAANGTVGTAGEAMEGLEDDDDDDGSPVVGGRRGGRLKRAQPVDSESEDDVEMVDADAAAGAAETEQRPQRRGRLAATAAVAAATGAAAGDGVTGGPGALAAAAAAGGDDGGAGYEEVEEEEDPEREVLAFEIRASEVERVKKECLPGSGGLDCPLLEEYDFSNDTTNPPLDIGLNRGVALRPYQEKSLSKMFGNGRARSGIIVLPCGAGKSLVGVAAAARIKKSCLCLCTSSVSVDQWAHQFTLWTNLHETDVVKFVAGTSSNEVLAEFNKQRLKQPCVCVTTFNMIAHGGKRSEYGKSIMDLISGREWGLLLLDEVHVVPARMFRQVIGIVKAHCKLGLTATLVREDELIGDLNFLIGPKLYEANWLDLTRAGHIANVQCVEVWCPMTREFYAEYLHREAQHDSVKQLLYVMNPNKFMVCQYLIDWHERVRGDKVIVFSDNVYALEAYAKALNKPFIYGKTSHAERTQVLSLFKNTNRINTVFLSKVGDNSLDIPEANVLIQISSHAGSRRQEAQRLGRILRAKKGKPGSSEEEEFSAFFYTLVSRDTQEMYYSAKRQQFLVDQGYAFKVLPALHITASAEPWVKYRTQLEQLELLGQVLHSKEVAESLARECSKDALEAGDKDDLVAKQKGWRGHGAGGRGGARKLGARSMGKATGGGDYVYNEWAKGGGAVGASGGNTGSGRMMVSGPQGAVAKQERAQRAKKIRQKLAT